MSLTGTNLIGLSSYQTLTVIRWCVQLFLQETTHYSFDLTGILRNRDHPLEPSIVAARLERAKCSRQEAPPIFIAPALLAMVKGVENEVVNGAWVFFFFRLACVPVYISGVPWIRSILWLVAIVGLLMMVLSCFHSN